MCISSRQNKQFLGSSINFGLAFMTDCIIDMPQIKVTTVEFAKKNTHHKTSTLKLTETR